MSARRACRYCPALITFVPLIHPDGTPVLNRSGARTTMPLDPEPSEQGNVRWDQVDGTALVLDSPGLEHARARGERLHLPHFATCPNAHLARRRREP